MSISIICPLYRGSNYIQRLHESLINQEKVNVIEILYIVTDIKGDNTISELERLNCSYKKINFNEFSHSLTREKAAYEAKGDIIVFITQDIKIIDDLWLYNLTKDIENGVCDAAYSKQICDNKTIERYTRMKNYGNKSRIVSKDDLKALGIMTYFYSDASSAIRKDIFVKLNGYDHKNLLTNEDMYIAYKIINSGYKIKYASDSVVNHSHQYKYSTLFHRYFDQGVFLAQNKYIKDAGDNSSALSLVKFVALRSLKECNIMAFIDIIPNFAVRFIANKLGQNYNKLSKKKVLKYTSNKNYWYKEVYNN